MTVPPSIWLARVSVFFAMGSGILLLGAVAFTRDGWIGFGFLLVLGWTGAAVHFLGWYVLVVGAYVDPAGRAIRAAGGTVVGFLVGLLAVAVLLPRELGWLFAALPYLPFVFGPVVVVHARLFLSFSDELPEGRDRWFVRTGSDLLIGLAAVGAFGQWMFSIAGADVVGVVAGDNVLRHVLHWIFFPYPAGLTALGYALVWSGWGAVAAREGASRVERGSTSPSVSSEDA